MVDTTCPLTGARGPLIPYLNHGSEHVLELKTKGYTVVKVCEEEKADKLYDGVWKDVEGYGMGVKRGDPSTYKKGWPQTTHGLFQNQNIGLQPGVCEARAETIRVWEEELFGKGEGGRRRCIGSFDGISFATPHYQSYAFKHGKEKDFPCLSNWLHTDQAKGKKGVMHHIQCAFALTELGESELKTQLVVPKEGETIQSFRDRFISAFPPPQESGNKRKGSFDAEREEWISHTWEEKKWLYENGEVVSPLLKAGEALFWSSGVPHASAAGPLEEGKKERRLRASSFVSAKPIEMLSTEEIEYRRLLLEKAGTSGHRVCEASSLSKPGKKKFRKCVFSTTGRTYGKELPSFFLGNTLRDFSSHRSDHSPHSKTAYFCGGY